MADASELDYDGTSTNDRRRIRAILDKLADGRHASWVNLDSDARAHGMMNAQLIERALL